MLLGTLTIILLLFIGVYAYMQHPKFGKIPTGESLELLKKSKHFRNGQFHNLTHTPSIVEGYSTAEVLWEFLFKKNPRRFPVDSIPSTKTDLLNLPKDENVLVWFGHSSYFIQIDGFRFLVDPVFSGNASPIPGTTKSFPGTEAYTVGDLPEIDFLLITHDHYDHLDYETISALKSKVKQVVCGLGVGSHLRFWGFRSDMIAEMDWDEEIVLSDSVSLFTTSSRHFSGRTFKRNTTLWLSFVLKTSKKKIFIGGDSGYDTHFSEIGKKHGPFDLVIIENGQYNLKWKYIHLLPEEVVKVSKELNSKRLFPVHSSKFQLANHSWDEPLLRVSKEAKREGVLLVTPIIGEKVLLDDEEQTFKEWWLDLE